MNISDNTIYVIGIDHSFLLEDVYGSLEEAIADIESSDRHHIAFQYTKNDHTARVYKTSIRELHIRCFTLGLKALRLQRLYRRAFRLYFA